jgi:hypothetical protein
LKPPFVGHEGNWIWSHSDVPLTESIWGTGFPNDNPSNTDDCGLLVIEPIQSWWQDSNCIATTVNQKKVAPICQHDSRVCPAGWELFDGRCYQLSMNKDTWENAEADCHNKGGHLASIHSLAEHNFISQLVDPGTWLWLGAQDTAHEVGITLVSPSKVLPYFQILDIVNHLTMSNASS